MLRITRETDYGIVLMTALALTEPFGESLSATALAKQCQLPLPMVSKILKALTQASLLVSQRGAHGGYSLARPAANVSVVDIIEALEGPIAITECSSDDPQLCAYHQQCSVSSHWNRINEAIRAALQNISLQEMSQLKPARQQAVSSIATISIAQ